MSRCSGVCTNHDCGCLCPQAIKTREAALALRVTTSGTTGIQESEQEATDKSLELGAVNKPPTSSRSLCRRVACSRNQRQVCRVSLGRLTSRGVAGILHLECGCMVWQDVRTGQQNPVLLPTCRLAFGFFLLKPKQLTSTASVSC